MQRIGRPKRSRALQACGVCRTRKNRCNEQQPCSYCLEHDLECHYSRPHQDKTKRRTANESNQRFSGAANSSTFKQPPAAHTDRSSRDGAQEVVAAPRQDFSGPGSASLEGLMSPSSVQVSLPPGFFPAGGDMQYSSSSRRSQPSQDSPAAFAPSMTSHSDAATARDDVVDTNSYTRNVEFYGGASSVAFLRHVEDISGEHSGGGLTGSSEVSLASLLHNTNFRPYSTSAAKLPGCGEKTGDRFCFRVARRFIEAYFSNIHYIQPIMDEESFLTRCEDLWFSKPEKQPMSFIALYYATLSLGSLLMTWDDREIYGAGRFSWSRKLFNEAAAIITQLGSITDLEMVQSYYMMSKVCQHELNPHVAYLYSGQATRTALAIGLNRITYGKSSNSDTSLTAAKTWWAVYCLDIQTSFALGRPDSLGPDEYHSQQIPGSMPLNMPDKTYQALQIIPEMIQLSRIMRSVSLRLYNVPNSIREKANQARELEQELSSWLQSLPAHLLPPNTSSQETLRRPARPVSFIQKQYVTLMIRYYNLRMILHGKFLTTLEEEIEVDIAPTVREYQVKCVESAGQTIDLMYETFRKENFFQTWWYNSTYALFAVSVLLTAVFQSAANPGQDRRNLDPILTQINRAIAVLEVMDDCIVTRNATSIVKRTLSRAERMLRGFASEQPGPSLKDIDETQQEPVYVETPATPSARVPGVDGMPQNVQHSATDFIDVDWMDTPLATDENQLALFWVEWAHHLDDLGA